MSKATKKLTPKAYDVVRAPVITEKAQLGVENNKVTFFVSVDATKEDIKKAVEGLFSVKVTKVNVINVKGKKKVFRGVEGRRKDRKKAVITLAEGSNIELSSGV